MVTLQTLENISTDTLLEVFNLSFSDYIVPLSLTKEQLEDKIKSDNIKLELSAGAFEEGQLIAFILHGYDLVEKLKIVYNGGTGVIPGKRGNKLTAKLYEYILPVLRKQNIDKIQLEVITTNIPAIKTYTQIGFKIVRQLNCFRGSINTTNKIGPFEIRELESYNWEKLRSFWDFEPTWQNSITAVETLQQSNVSIGSYEAEKLLGYLIYNPKIKRVQQFSVDKSMRNRGIGCQLFDYISANFNAELSVINVDDNSKNACDFLTARGLKQFVTQYDMELSIK